VAEAAELLGLTERGMQIGTALAMAGDDEARAVLDALLGTKTTADRQEGADTEAIVVTLARQPLPRSGHGV